MKTIKLIIALALFTAFFTACTPQDAIVDASSQTLVKTDVAATSGNGAETIIRKGD